MRTNFGRRMRINLKRLEKNIAELKKIGLNKEDGGTYRMGFSSADMEARRWFLQKAKKAGLSSYMDTIGNVFARDERSQSNEIFMVGSHLDSVPCGGNLDGALGVLAGLECAQTIIENDINLNCKLEIIGTSEEEGRFGGMIGTETLLGEMTKERIQKSKDSENISLAQAMVSAGLNPDKALESVRSTENIRGFLELHIEQGPVLEQKNIDIGIVEGMSGIIHWRVQLRGEANHSGTTPMNMRKDAFQGAVEFCHALKDIIEKDGTKEARASVGKLDIIPPNPHTIPGLVEFNLVIRDFTEQSLNKIKTSLEKKLNEICENHQLDRRINELSFIPPALCCKELNKTLELVAKRRGFKYQLMPSGAGHDTQFFLKHVPASMFFIPSHKGISHSPDEYTSPHHIEIGANFLLESLLELLGSR